MKISNWAVKKPVSVFMLIAIVLLLGAVSIFRLPMDLLPQMNIPVAMVTVRYPGAGPFEIENMITRPLEEVLATVHNVKKLSSSSAEGVSTVTIEFNQGTDMDFATLQMRERIDLIKDFLPEDALTPMVLKVDPNQLPIMILALGGSNDLSRLQIIAEKHIKPRLERLDGVASVSITGGTEDIIEIVFNPDVLSSYNITAMQLMNLLRTENVNLPGGEVAMGNRNVLIRTVGEFGNLEEIRNLPIPLPTGGSVPLEEIVEINLTQSDAIQIVKINGEKAIRMAIQKQANSNTVTVTNIIHREIDELTKSLDDISIDPVIDQSIFIRRSVYNVGATALIGGILAILILYLFMKNIRVTLVIALSIPISIIATFTLMYFSGITLNLLSLGGFALGVGMLVDNAIVVLENIFRYREEGYEPKEASINGASEVSMAVTASTLTTVAVFLPIAFVEGVTAEIFRELALTVTFSLLASLVVSLTLVPMLCSQMLSKKHNSFVCSGVHGLFNKLFDSLSDKYARMLSWSMYHRKTVILLIAILFIITISLSLFTGSEYFPDFDDGMFMINIRLPHGANISETTNIAENIENILYDYKDVKTVFTNIGGGDVFFDSHSGRSHMAVINARLVPASERKMTTAEIIDSIRRDLNRIAGADISISGISSFMGMGMGGTSIEIEIKGDDLEMLKIISEDFIDIVDNVRGTREVTSNYMEGRPQMEIKLNRDIASQYGLQAAQVATTVRNILNGTSVTKFRLMGKELDVIMRGEKHFKHDLSNFMLMPITTVLGVNVPLEQIAQINNAIGPSVIRRSDQVRTVTVSATLFNRDLNSVVGDIENRLEDYNLPAGYSYQFRGQREQYEEAMNSLILAVILAILLVYMILAAQFQSFLYPFIIILSVPLAFSGGVLGLFISRRPISVPAVIGAIVLAGIVVNNGIVLIDYINTLRYNGKDRVEAILQAGPTRLRPIMMTTLTTVLGLFPLALGIGEGAEVQAPLATVVIGGLILSTVLTLIAMPVIYLLLDDLKVKVLRKNNDIIK
ncbi:efflux RND transporter permease subunit [Serpentinicella alkaliphila]|uniref:HAE1 family hydrophobic/amphiphilic exporter-1 n=1 Tax=Serpentinicella alkaliphila TaxID=1734049 RepID=A0A4R2TWZ2_9FIRM|nr:efflux RND transporter permease subunit [Serpentinicella alkaliphila]QUH25973.1 efflux RND transporter permease subunit [Serpentinicella alkaliphila]TCQ02169.1 HAE1 family hydrophobic/amphiphilic exporter-1 [Serpentinicella alkaliphila]